MSNVTRILSAIEQGDAKAADELLPLVYEELRRLASRKMSLESPGQTLQATALVHEAYIRLIGAESRNWSNRGHFFAAAAEAMRRILIDNVRRKQRQKHGGNRQRVGLEDADITIEGPSANLIALDEALTKLSKEDKTVAELVKLRYFAGLTIDQMQALYCGNLAEAGGMVGQRLLAEMQAGGPTQAVRVCSEVAQDLAAVSVVTAVVQRALVAAATAQDQGKHDQMDRSKTPPGRFSDDQGVQHMRSDYSLPLRTNVLAISNQIADQERDKNQQQPEWPQKVELLNNQIH